MKLRGDMLKEEKTIKQKAKNIYILFLKLCENNVKKKIRTLKSAVLEQK